MSHDHTPAGGGTPYPLPPKDMPNPARTNELNATRLARLTDFSRFRQKVQAVLTDLSKEFDPYIVEDPLRTPEEQAEKVAQGFSKSLHSYHLPCPKSKDQLAAAVDIVTAAELYKAPKLFWAKLARAYVEHGIFPGILFGLKTVERRKLLKALKDKDWDTAIKCRFGWDPSHGELNRYRETSWSLLGV